MSLRYLYNKLAPWERICPVCGRVIERNIALHEEEPYHYGCLQQAKQVKWRCQGCYSLLTTLETVRATVAGQQVRGCARCGSPVKPLHTWSPPPLSIAGGGIVIVERGISR